jgi:3-oxoacyl-[acyl-carrier protein] reductase
LEPSLKIPSERLDGRVALVTGGSRGIGRAVAIVLAARGAKVIVHFRSQESAAAAVVAEVAAAGGAAAAVQADLAEAAAANLLVEQAAAVFGPIDILVNNAGEATKSAVVDMPDELWEHTLALNLSSAFRCARVCIPAMRERAWGRIINMSSQAAYNGSANHAHYSAAKAGLLGFTFSLAKELGPTGITVNVVSPGRIITDMLRDLLPGREEEWLRQTPMRRIGEPEEVAAAVAFLASNAASYITGANLNVNGGMLMG